MFEVGFFGTRAPLYLDIVGVFFVALPFLMAISILYAVKGKIQQHVRSQQVLFILTMLMVVVFEVGMRLSGGFLEYMKSASVSMTFMSIFLIIHIIIALLSVVLWAYQLIASMKAYTNATIDTNFKMQHIKIGKYVFLGLCITSFMGAAIYYFLFMI